MGKEIRGFLVVAVLGILSFSAVAEEGEESIRAALQKWLPEMEPQSIHSTPIPGIYEVVLEGQVYYLSQDGRYLMQGQLVDLMTRTNLTEARLKVKRAAALSELNEKNMIVFSPQEPKYTVSVFTDIDCGYCRRLHQQVKGYNDLGIKIRYLAFPRAGIGSSSYDKAVEVWCAKDRRQAMTRAKADKPVENTFKCENPVAKQFNLGRSLGINATPSLILEDGTLLAGFIPPQALASYLEKNLKNKKYIHIIDQGGLANA